MLRYRITINFQIYYHNSVFSSLRETKQNEERGCKDVTKFLTGEMRINVVSRDSLRFLAIGYGAERIISLNRKTVVSVQTGLCSLKVLL